MAQRSGLPPLRRCGPERPPKGKSTRIGTYKCYACRKPFTVKIWTIFEASHIKLHIWLQVDLPASGPLEEGH